MDHKIRRLIGLICVTLGETENKLEVLQECLECVGLLDFVDLVPHLNPFFGVL